MALNQVQKGNFAIVVSGGPAPGINSVISAAAIEIVNRGMKVFGLREGFEAIAQNLPKNGDPEALMELTIPKVSGIHNTGGSILGTSRYNPFLTSETRDRMLRNLKEANIDKLIVVGGEGSAYLSAQFMQCCPEIKVIHVPKTIDNDLILPNQHPSFGFETARYVGTNILDTLMVDARTTRRWFLVTSMGRKAGFLALGLGLAAGATSTLIPEEFSDNTSVDVIAAEIFKSIERRHAIGRNYGVIVIAEGILGILDSQSSPELRACEHDSLGRIRYSHVELGDILVPHIRRLCKERGVEIQINTKNLGYELRCHSPVSFDIEYTKFLGYGAVKHLCEGKNFGMVTRDFDKLGFKPLSEMMLPDGSIQSRRVDLQSDLYQVARSFMIR